MIKMTITLLVALYATFIIWGEPINYAEVEAATDTDPSAIQTGEFDGPIILGNASAPEAAVTRTATQDVIVPDPAVIAASAPEPTTTAPTRIGEPVVVSLYRQAEPARELEQTEVPKQDEVSAEPDLDLLRVTGTVVNMRAGPSSANQVVGSLPRGTVAEAIGAPQNGWQQIRDLASGQTGWMFARFLEPS